MLNNGCEGQLPVLNLKFRGEYYTLIILALFHNIYPLVMETVALTKIFGIRP